MYKVYADGICVYDDSFIMEDQIISTPKLVLEDNSAGSFEMILPPTNVAYELIERFSTNIQVLKDNKEIWSGRVLSDSFDFWKNR